MNLCQSTSKATRGDRVRGRYPKHKRDTAGRRPPRLPSEGRGHRFESCRVRQLAPFLEHRFLSATAGHLRRGACPLPGSPNRPVRTPPRGTRPRPARLA